jgi:hypothetical protein
MKNERVKIEKCSVECRVLIHLGAVNNAQELEGIFLCFERLTKIRYCFKSFAKIYFSRPIVRRAYKSPCSRASYVHITQWEGHAMAIL